MEAAATTPITHHTDEASLVILKGVFKSYGPTKAVKNLNLTINKGEFVSLVGPSGAGKSTLIRLLIREESPDGGQIFIAGRDITTLKTNELPYYRRKIGVVFQDFKLLPHKTVTENISFALEVSDATVKEIATRVPRILELVGLTARRDNYPHELSGGERQRVAIARSMVRGPKILIADEPTGNLDPENADEVVAILNRINATGTVVLLATHNKQIVDQLKRRVITMRAGEVVSDRAQGGYVI